MLTTETVSLSGARFSTPTTHLINALSVRMGDARYPSESRRRERHRGFACSALSPELAYHSFFLIAQVLFEGLRGTNAAFSTPNVRGSIKPTRANPGSIA